MTQMEEYFWRRFGEADDERSAEEYGHEDVPLYVFRVRREDRIAFPERLRGVEQVEAFRDPDGEVHLHLYPHCDVG